MAMRSLVVEIAVSLGVSPVALGKAVKVTKESEMVNSPL